MSNTTKIIIGLVATVFVIFIANASGLLF